MLKAHLCSRQLKDQGQWRWIRFRGLPRRQVTEPLMRTVAVEHGAEARPDWCLQWNWGKGSAGEDGILLMKTASGAQAASRITVPWRSSEVIWTGVCATWSDYCEVSPALSRLCWRSAEIPSSLCCSTGHHINWLTLRGAAVGAPSTVFYGVLLDEKDYSCETFADWVPFFMLGECWLLRWA